ncbi:hypothetical protein SEA_LOZINAK_90 [Gordonia phage Lozinak]|uniref:Uncharacterized protein n=3 Tax=Smoothievirus TaxID=1982557 RepID=A0A2D1GG06_9CAUD|nr:hypothetical protein BEN60_gp116 [Gordonia phage Smoothie]YP_009276203.1 hypothetical protein BH772_gp119 [Gordonia phage Bachita]YP_009281245.1 hypothetical protein BIZ74_gp114 [Gordonia phage Cucurbita]ATN90716.1 hypothetical protein SEA_LOZINAK_90 [Gordonia phage Lozinak]QKY79667.1 hypothetical protein SEA_ENGINEER_91 [Gordonia Phage Engineer]ANA86247.1 hypothetical protein PBI_SMOOTHIE_91 [Gordonia phage Smoothie]ANA86767.1 hypothetical protein PBI_BACHITA_92 [Gordonia phage Bachita]A
MIIKPPAMAHPFQLAALPNTGPEDPYGCVMNVVSWMKGDTDITGEPDCVNHHLINLCQTFNDEVLDRFGSHEREYPEMLRLVGVASAQQSMRLLEIAELVTDTAVVTQGESREWAFRKLRSPLGIYGAHSVSRQIATSASSFDDAVDQILDIIHDFRSTFAEELGLNQLEETRV